MFENDQHVSYGSLTVETLDEVGFINKTDGMVYKPMPGGKNQQTTHTN